VRGARFTAVSDGILDTGADASILSTAEAGVLEENGHVVYMKNPVHIKFADGRSGAFNRKIDFGNEPMYIAEKKYVPDTLISAGAIADAGYRMSFDSEKLVIDSLEHDVNVEVPRDEDGTWRLPLDFLESIHNSSGELMNSYCLTSEGPVELKEGRVLSGRLHTANRSLKRRVLNLHERMLHATEDIMCLAVSDGAEGVWKNTGLTDVDIRKVFRHHTCLECVLAKRNADDALRYKKKSGLSYTVKDASEYSERQWEAGECICVDDFGPINPSTKRGETRGYIFKDVASHKTFISIEENCTSATFIEAFQQIITFFKSKAKQVKVLRSDFKDIYYSLEAVTFLDENCIKPESSTPYQHYQNSVERDVQSMTKAVSAMIHTSPFMRKDMWADAMNHYVAVSGHIPNSVTGLTPNQFIDGETLDCSNQFQYTFGEVIVWGKPKKTREWKFDVKNEVGIYLGDIKGSKGAVLAYHPYKQTTSIRGNVWKVNVSDLQLMSWYQAQYNLTQSGTPYQIVEDNFYDLLQYDEPISYFSEEPEEEADQQAEPVRLRIPLAEYTQPERSRTFRGKRKQKSVRSGRRVTWEDEDDESWYNPPILEESVPTSEVRHSVSGDTPQSSVPDDEAAVADLAKNIFNLDQLATEDTEAENLSLVQACLEAHDREQWHKEIKREIIDSILGSTHSLEPVSDEWVRENVHHFIGTTVKCKRKKKGSGLPDKLKARMAMRGDQLIRMYKKKGLTRPLSYSPTVSTLTHNTVFQLSIKLKKLRATGDITAAYLQVPYPESSTPIVTKLERIVAEACGLDPNQQYRVKKYIYGLPDSGRAFFYSYKASLLAEGYAQAMSDPCLFYKNDEEHGDIWLECHVDDTYVYANTREGLLMASSDINRHYHFTLDEKADSFLGIMIEQLDNGDAKLSQPKLMKQILSKYPRTRKLAKKATHPYGPVSDDTPPNEDHPDNQPCDYIEYMSLLGQLMYLTRSRPELQTALSIAATKSTIAKVHDYKTLYHCVNYLHDNPDIGYLIRANVHSIEELQLICQVDASYLFHKDSKGQSGYLISFDGFGTFYCRSIKQSQTSTSSTHSEVRALYSLVKEIIFIMTLCEELKVQLRLPSIIMEDNSATVQLAQEEASYLKKCKHFLMLIHYIKEQVISGLISIKKIRGDKNAADLLTKRLRGSDFQTKARQILGYEDLQLEEEE